MKVTIGKGGLEKTWQDDFPETTKCKCSGDARIAFVAHEGIDDEPKDFVSDLHPNEGKGGFWPHDACAVAVYFCQDCFTPMALFNQAQPLLGKR